MNLNKYNINANWARNCSISCPTIDISARASKNDVKGFYLLSFDDAFVKFNVTKIGNVTKRS